MILNITNGADGTLANIFRFSSDLRVPKSIGSHLSASTNLHESALCMRTAVLYNSTAHYNRGAAFEPEGVSRTATVRIKIPVRACARVCIRPP